jgi:hypothetical protein
VASSRPVTSTATWGYAYDHSADRQLHFLRDSVLDYVSQKIVEPQSCTYHSKKTLLPPDSIDVEFFLARDLPCAFLFDECQSAVFSSDEKLRTERRKIFRLCLRRLAHDRNRLHHALRIVLVQSPEDGLDLATLAEGWLTLHACGFDRILAIDLLQPLQTMQMHLRLLAPPQCAYSGSRA